MTHEASTGLSEGRVGRYILDDLVAETSGSQLWRASDPALQRPVGARLIPLSDPKVDAIRQAAKAAAGVHDRRIVQVLDVVETERNLAVITEWVEGQPWSELVLGAEQPAEAVIVAYEVACAIRAAQSQGVTHGRIRPSSVIITDTNEVRLRGLGVDAALHGIAPGEDARAADLHGIGAILYVGLTGRWPAPGLDAATVDGLPTASPVSGRLPSPSEVTAGVPAALSDLASACLWAPVRPRTRTRIPDVDHAVAALARAVERTTGSSPDPAGDHLRSPTRTDRMIRAIAVLVLAGIAVAAAMLFVGSVSGEANGRHGADPVAPATNIPSNPGSFGPAPLPIASLTDFDPQGSDQRENPDLVPLANDGDAATAWRTVNYRSSTMSPKQGTGLLIDLGLSRPMSAVSLQLLGGGTDVEIRVAEARGTSADDFELLAGAVAAGDEIVLRTPIPVQTRYVLVWLTSLPYQDGSYIGGVREVKVLG